MRLSLNLMNTGCMPINFAFCYTYYLYRKATRPIKLCVYNYYTNTKCQLLLNCFYTQLI